MFETVGLSLYYIIDVPFFDRNIFPFFATTGGLVCCGVRDDDLKEYHGKMVELEKAGHWKLVKERKVPYYDREDMPTQSTAFVYKVSKH